MNYLSEAEQYKEILNNDEISRIKDSELREIRSRYWNLRHKAFLNEIEIPDTEIENVNEKLMRDEKDEIEKFKNRQKQKFR